MTTSEIPSQAERDYQLEQLIAENAEALMQNVAEASRCLWFERGLLFAASLDSGSGQVDELKENRGRIKQANRANEIVAKFIRGHSLFEDGSGDGVSEP